MWNIEYKEPAVNFFDKEEDVVKIYENQREYESNQHLKQINENYKNK